MVLIVVYYILERERYNSLFVVVVVVDAEELLDQSLCTWVTKSSICPSFQPGPASSATNVGASSRSPSKTVAPRTAGTSARQR